MIVDTHRLGNKKRGEKFYHLRHHLIDFIKLNDIREVVYEHPFNLQGAAIRALNGYIAIIEEFCHIEDIPAYHYSPMTIKKLATGSGKASKEEVINSAIAKWAVNGITSDEADALWMLYLHLGCEFNVRERSK